MPGAVGAQVQLAEFRRDGLGNDGFPIDVVHAERLGHGAVEHDVHAFGIAELLGDLSFILIDVASGGDMTPAGDFATPVQTAYLCRDGLPVGRLPEFSFRGSVFDLLGGGFLGRTDGGPLGGDGWTLLEGTIDA